MKTIALKKFQLFDAYRTAPASMGLLKLLMRMAGTFADSRYGSEFYDAVVVGDDPIAALGLALTLQKAGARVLIAPDSLSTQDWPSKEWGYQLAQTVNDFDANVAYVIAKNLDGYDPQHGYMKALSLLIKECAATKQVSILHTASLQSSQGVIKGCSDLIFFPLHRDYQHLPLLNPLWRLVRDKLRKLSFNHVEIEFVRARKLYITTPPSKFIDPKLGIRVGLAREGQADTVRHGRADDVQSAFIQQLGDQ